LPILASYGPFLSKPRDFAILVQNFYAVVFAVFLETSEREFSDVRLGSARYTNAKFLVGDAQIGLAGGTQATDTNDGRA